MKVKFLECLVQTELVKVQFLILITGLIHPNSGKIKLNNTDVLDYPIYLRTKKFHIGYVPQYGGYFNDLTLYQNLKAIAEIVINDKN